MMINDYQKQVSRIEEQQRRLLQEAQAARLMRDYDPNRKSAYLSLIATLGDLLIATGTKLKAQAEFTALPNHGIDSVGQ